MGSSHGADDFSNNSLKTKPTINGWPCTHRLDYNLLFLLEDEKQLMKYVARSCYRRLCQLQPCCAVLIGGNSLVEKSGTLPLSTGRTVGRLVIGDPTGLCGSFTFCGISFSQHSMLPLLSSWHVCYSQERSIFELTEVQTSHLIYSRQTQT